MKKNVVYHIAITIIAVASLARLALGAELQKPLDREAIVARHHIQTNQLTPTLPVGNGNLCFNVDGTGLQTFGGDVLSHWGWYSDPLPSRYSWDDVPETGSFQKGRLSGTDPFPATRGDLYAWIRQSPHQMNLVRTRFLRADGSELKVEELSDVVRELNLWTGIHTTSFKLDGETVTVMTCITDEEALDSAVVVKIDSTLVRSGNLVVEVAFPYPCLFHDRWTGDFANQSLPYRVTTPDVSSGISSRHVKRFLRNELYRDFVADYSYGLRVDATNGEVVQVGSSSTLRISGNNSPEPLEIAFLFDGGDYSSTPCDDSGKSAEHVTFNAARQQSCARWFNFWNHGGAVDLSESVDPRWFELERRIVLSQFQLRTNSAGRWPSSESGLLNICPWSGRFHMEMIWWHLIFWWGWDRKECATDAISIYHKIISRAQQLAKQCDYKGAQWQKEIAPDGRAAPWMGNLVLLWKQPHPIYFAEMDYRSDPTQETLAKWSEIVEETAAFMADYPSQDEDGIYHLSPAMPPSELGVTSDDIFDLVYWRWGLDMANQWRERQGKERNAHWDDLRNNLATLPTINGNYIRSAEWGDDFANKNWEHPDLIGIYGMLPAIPEVNKEIALHTLERVIKEWQWDRCWGWDFPMTAMAASRLGRPDLAVEILLHDSTCNAYPLSGANFGGPAVSGGKGEYLPGNAGLLFAIAGMCVGYDETNDSPVTPTSGDTAPGFPDGFSVKWEKLKRPL